MIFQVLAGFLYCAEYLPKKTIEDILKVKETEIIAPAQTDDNERSDHFTPDELGKLAKIIKVDRMKIIDTLMEIDSPLISHVETDSEGSWLFNFSILTLWTYKSTGNKREVTHVVFIFQKPSKYVVFKICICPFISNSTGK